MDLYPTLLSKFRFSGPQAHNSWRSFEFFIGNERTRLVKIIWKVIMRVINHEKSCNFHPLSLGFFLIKVPNYFIVLYEEFVSIAFYVFLLGSAFFIEWEEFDHRAHHAGQMQVSGLRIPVRKLWRTVRNAGFLNNHAVLH